MAKQNWWVAGLVFAIGISPSFSLARIGETRDQLESRLLSRNRAEELEGAQRNEVLNHRRFPLRAMLDLMPEDDDDRLELVVYFKYAEDESVHERDLREGTIPPGWLLTVVFFEERSVAEIYQRHESDLSEPEVRALLVLQQEGSVWQQVRDHSESEFPPVLPLNYFREDEAVGAYKAGNALVFYSLAFEEFFRPLQQQLKEESAQRAEASAPESVIGF